MELNTIYCMDCLEGMKDIDDGSIDMILCDLPYGTTECEWDSVIPFEPLWEQYRRVITDTGSIVLFSSGVFTAQLISSNIGMYKYKYVWIKKNSTNFVHAKNRPMTAHEDILVFSKAPMGHVSQLGEKRMTYNPQNLKPKKRMNDNMGKFGTVVGVRPSHKEISMQTHTNYPKDVLWNFAEPRANEKMHTSQKPVPLCEYLIKTYTNEGDLVLDNCAGSGTTGVACIRAGRRFILMELDEKYAEMAQERIFKEQSQSSLKDYFGGAAG